jgi:hypothetical protein
VFGKQGITTPSECMDLKKYASHIFSAKISEAPQMPVVLAALVYLSRARPVAIQYTRKDRLSQMLCGALVIAAKVYFPYWSKPNILTALLTVY